MHATPPSERSHAIKRTTVKYKVCAYRRDSGLPSASDVLLRY